MRVRLEIPPGINTDDTAFRYPGTWRDADQVRFWKGVPEVIGGWEYVSNNQLPGVCRTVLTWTNPLSISYIAAGLHNGLSIIEGSEIFDITPSSDFTPGTIDGTGSAGYGTGSYGVGDYGETSSQDYFPLTWSLANWGESLMANPRGQTIFWWQNDTGTPAATLTGSPEQVIYTLVTYTRQVMAFGCNEEVSGDFNSMCIRFSDLENPEDWTTLPSNNAGEVILEGSGRIIAAKAVGDYIFVWTNNSLFQGSFTGDNTNPWSFTKIGDNCGLAGPNAVSVVSQTAYWFSSQKRFMSCSLGGVPQMVYLSVGDDMAANIAPSQSDKIVATNIAKFNEVWWFYPDKRDGNEISRYVSLSVEDGAASRGTLARTAFCDMSAGANLFPIGVDYNGYVYYHEKGITANGDPRSWYIESSDFFIDESQKCMMVNRMWPDFQRQSGPVYLELRALQYPQSDPVILPIQALTMSTGKVDFRFSGRLMRLRLYGNSSPTDMRLGIPVFDAQYAGDR